MLSLGHEPQAQAASIQFKLTDVERVGSYLDGTTRDRESAKAAARSLFDRLVRLKGKTQILNKVELSRQASSLTEN